MECPKCHHENNEKDKFCRECGAELNLACPKCQAEILAADKFCGECGHNINLPVTQIPKEYSFDEKIDKIQRYLPKGLTEKILAQRDKIEGERKQVSVMFCDLEGFTPLVEKLGSEKAYSVMNDIYEILIHKVHDYEGTVNEMTGDGIMALFGAPIALEDSSQRAIRASLAIHREMARFNDKMKLERDDFPAFKIRSGIHTGPVVVGTLGNDLRVEFKAVGDTVNLASRLESLAQAGTTYISEDTFTLTEGLFRFEALGEKAVKGKEKPVRIYQVIAPSTRRTRFDVSAERGLTHFVGRERELDLLMDGFERVRGGKGQAFSIISEAGVGKSRLLYEFRKSVTNENVTFLEGRCLSYGRGMAYHPMIDLLKSNFDIKEEDDDLEIKEKVKKGIKLVGLDEKSSLPYFLELLSVKDSGLDQISMSPEARKDRMIEALKGIVLKGSEIRPLIMAIEDLHWIDKASEEAVKNILESIPGFRVFLIFTYRPQFIHTWGGKSYHNQLTLHRLSNRESLEMATHILRTDKIEKPLEELILEKTEGIPFFIEEFIKSLTDLEIIEKEDNRCGLSKNIQKVMIPSTIQDVIMARVDSLPETAKEVIQTGSAIEREFPYPLIKLVTGLREQELLSQLSILKDAELLYERGIFPNSSYVFSHALTREVIYDSILAKTRKKHHEEIANSIEELFKDNLWEQYEVLSEHFFLGENYLKGAEYSRLASRKAKKRVSLNDAIVYSKRRITCIERLPRSETVERQIIDSRVRLGLYQVEMQHFADAMQIIGPVIDLTRKYNDKKRFGQICAVIGSYHFWVEENAPASVKTFEDALHASEEVGDLLTIALASIGLGNSLCWSCEFERSETHFKRVIDINLAANNLYGIAVNKAFFGVSFYYLQGKMDLALKTTTEALHIAEESGDIYSKAHAYSIQGMSYYGKGSFDEAQKHLIKGIEFCEKVNLHSINAIAQFHIGEICLEIGDFLRSKESFEEANRMLEVNQLFPSWASVGKVGIAISKVMSKEKDVDLESLFNYSRNNKLKVFEGWMAYYIGDILLNQENPEFSKAEHWILKALEADQRNGMMFRKGKDYALYAVLLKQKGATQEAKENLGKAIEILKECGANGWVEKYEKKLASLS